MAFEKEVSTILEISQDIEKIKERLIAFSYDIETDDVAKALKQVKTLSNTVERIVEHLSSLTTIEEFRGYLDSKLEEEKKKIDLDIAIDKVRRALHNNAMIDSVTLGFNRITKEDMEMVCNHFGIDYYVGSHGSWAWVQFKKDDVMLSSDDLREIGLIETKIVSKKEIVKKQEIDEKKEVTKEEVLPFGWVSPSGEFLEGDFGEHEEKAIEIIKSKGFKEEFNTWKKDENRLLARDFLVEIKGYILLHNPYVGGMGRTITTYEKQPTKKQCEFLYDYFSRENDKEQADFFIQMIG